MDFDGVLEVADALGLLVGRPYTSEKFGPNVSISCPLAPYTHGDELDSNKSCSITLDPDGPSKARCWSFSCGFKGSLWYLIQRAVGARNPVPPKLAALVEKIKKTEEPTLERGIDAAELPAATESYADGTKLPSDPAAVGTTLFTPLPGTREAAARAAMPKTREGVIRLYERDVLDESVLNQFSKDLPAYVWERGITKETAEFWGILYDERLGRVVFPVRRFDGKLIGLTGRILPSREEQADREGWDVTKYHNYSGLNKTRYLYGAHTWKRGLPHVITEGPFDLLKTWQALRDRVNVGATLGQGFAEDHRRMLTGFNAGGTYLFFDDDSAGHRAAEKVGTTLADDMPIWLMRPTGGKDPGAMVDSAIVYAFEHPTGPIIGDIVAAIAGIDPLA